jgi:3-phenylpropionate/trans-cinnamate dioxygenase ferredoxin reductase subunit
VVPYFWSDLAEWAGFEYVSAGAPSRDPVVRGSMEEGAFSAWWLGDDGRVVAALVVGREGELEEARAAIAEGLRTDRQAVR